MLTANVAAGENWGHWRGPTGNCVSNDATPPIEWSLTENLKWKTAIPVHGSSSPVAWEDRVFVLTAISANDDQAESQSEGLKRFEILCIDRNNGQVRWQKTANEVKVEALNRTGDSFASASPFTDGEHVYAHFGSRGLYCYTMDGELVWERRLGDMYPRNGYGEGSTPAISGNMIVVPWDHDGGSSCLFALDKTTGETIWKTDRADEESSWATPLIVSHGGASQIIMNGETYFRGYDLATGAELWRYERKTKRSIPSPVAANGLVYVVSGSPGACLGAFDLKGRGDIKGTKSVVWELTRDTPDIASPLLSGDRLYFIKGRAGILSCVAAAAGTRHYQSRVPGLKNVYASPVAAGGHVYLTDRDGTTVVIEDSTQLKVVATNSIGETVTGTPALIGNDLIILGESHLYCFTNPDSPPR